MLLHVVRSAEVSEIVLRGWAAFDIGNGVVEVAAGGGADATGKTAGDVAHLQESTQRGVGLASIDGESVARDGMRQDALERWSLGCELAGLASAHGMPAVEKRRIGKVLQYDPIDGTRLSLEKREYGDRHVHYGLHAWCAPRLALEDLLWRRGKKRVREDVGLELSDSALVRHEFLHGFWICARSTFANSDQEIRGRARRSFERRGGGLICVAKDPCLVFEKLLDRHSNFGRQVGINGRHAKLIVRNADAALCSGSFVGRLEVLSGEFHGELFGPLLGFARGMSAGVIEQCGGVLGPLIGGEVHCGIEHPKNVRVLDLGTLKCFHPLGELCDELVGGVRPAL